MEPDSGAAACSSTMVFHAPQPSQRPDHLVEAEPQDWQTKCDVLAMPLLAEHYANGKGLAPQN